MGHLLMSTKERERLKVLARVKKSEMKLKEAAELLGVSYRQAKRQYGRYREEGDKGLVHRGRGRAGNRGYSQDFKKKVIARYQERYPDFGPTLAAEKLEEDGYKLNPETLRLWLVEAGIWQKRRKRAAHRSWRERRAHFGEMLQLDGSHHRWFEERGEKSCLMNLVDDATGTTLSFFAKEETTEAAMILLWAWIDKYGIPAAIYVDRKNVYVPDEKQVLEAREEGREHYTQFGRACAQLGIRVIKAYSPQAKGRVERSHGVYQDRLVKELRLKKINSIESANQLLSSGFTDNLNRKFAIQAREAADYHRNSKGYDLASIFCIEEDRILTDDWIVRFNNDFYQLQRQSNASPTSKKVKVRQYLNGEIRFSYRDKETNYEKLAERPQSKAEAPLRISMMMKGDSDRRIDLSRVEIRSSVISTAGENLSPSSKPHAFHDRRICLSQLEFSFHVPSKNALDAGVDIRKVQDLLGHRHITTTQVYDKRRISTSQSASHDVPI